MVEAVPSPAMTPHYARLVLEAATFRRIEQCGTRIAQVGRSHRGTPNDAFETLTTTWRDLADARDRWQTSHAPRSVDGKSGDRPRLVEGIDHDVATRTARAR
jgi:replicative DNA helicase